MRAVGIEVDFDPRLDEMRAHRAFRDLQFQPPERHAVVVADLALLLDAEDVVEIDPGDRGEGGARLSLRRSEARIVLRKIDLAEEGVGLFDRRDPGEPELVDQPVLQRPERPLRASPGLRRIGANVLDPELLERPADLRQAIAAISPPASGVRK